MLRYVLLLAAILTVFTGSAYADILPCSAGTIATVMTQGPCTIGDKTFDFTSYAPDSLGTSTPVTALDILFTPLTNNPLAPGFELAAAFSSTGGGYSYDTGRLDYNVSVTNGSADIIGTNTQVNNGTLATTPPTVANSETFALYEGANYLNSTQSFQYGYQSQQTGSSATPVYDSSGPKTFAPIISGSGEAFFETEGFNYSYTTETYGSAGGTATAAMSSIDYYFLEQTAPVPEPTSILLLATTLVLVTGLIKRKRRRA